MILFWLIIATMLLMSLFFSVYPAMKKTITKNNKSDNLKKNIFQQQLRELDSELSAGLLNPVTYQSARNELAASFIQDQKIETASSHIGNMHGNDNRSWVTAMLFILFIPVFSISMYFYLGASNEVSAWLSHQNNQAKIQAIESAIKSPQQLIMRMQQILKLHPQSTQGWYLLGRLYMSMDQYQQAEIALAKANVLKPNDLNIMLQYSQVLFLIHDRKLNNQANILIQQILKQDPNNPGAKNLLALNAYENKKYKEAIIYWEQLLQQFPPNSDEGKLLLQEIAKAQQQL